MPIGKPITTRGGNCLARAFAALAAASVLVVGLTTATSAQTAAQTSRDRAVGENLVGQYCVACHSVKAGQPSPHQDAPSLTGLSKNYPVEALAEALAEGIVTGHPDMPVFVFDAASVDGIIVYLQSIQEAR